MNFLKHFSKWLFTTILITLVIPTICFVFAWPLFVGHYFEWDKIIILIVLFAWWGSISSTLKWLADNHYLY